MDSRERTHAPHEDTQSGERSGTNRKSYLRFAAMVITAMGVMYALTYVNTFQLSHVRWSETRFFMTLVMGASMAVIMLGFMLGMYRNRTINMGILVGGLLVFALGTFLVRSQVTVQDRSYMSAMIPHHSIAILTSENSQISDVRVCELAARISEAQRREIEEMKWLLDDIERNGVAGSAAEAQERPVPPFQGDSTRTCPAS